MILLPLLEGMIKSFVISSKFLIAAKSLPFHETLKLSFTKSINTSKLPLFFNSERFTAPS